MEDTIREDTIQTGSHRCSNEKERNYASAGWFSQFVILLERSLKERSHETFNMLRMIKVMAAAVLAGAMWWESSIENVRDHVGLLFFISIFWGVIPSFNAVFTFPQERAILVKERASGMYSLSSYFMARMAGDLPMEHQLVAFLLTLVVLLSYVLVAQGFGLLLGAIIMDAKKRTSTVVTITMLAFLLIAGFYLHHVPAVLAWLKYTSFTYYCFRLLIVVQYNGLNSSLIGSPEVIRELDEKVSIVVCITMLAMMLVVYRSLAYVALHRMQNKIL